MKNERHHKKKKENFLTFHDETTMSGYILSKISTEQRRVVVAQAHYIQIIILYVAA